MSAGLKPNPVPILWRGSMVAERQSTARYEPETQVIAHQLLARMEGKRSLLGQLRQQIRWDDKLMNWAMANPSLRVQLFHLIDCLPTLEHPADIARHLQEYLDLPAVELPTALKQILNFTASNSLPAQVAATTFTTAVTTLAQRFIAGDTVPQLLQTLQQLRKQKMAFTLDMLGEAVITEQEAEQYLQSYLEIMTQLSQAASGWSAVAALDQADGTELPKVQISVKLTAFYSQFDPIDPLGSQRRVGDRIRLLLRHAQALGVAVHFDMEQYVYKDLTLAILKDLLMEPEFRDRTDIGITLQAYLRDSDPDLKELIQWAQQRGYPITVRLVKGAYWDQETIHALQQGWPQPVYHHKPDTDANFERMTQRLLENHQVLYAAIGSHNLRSQAKALAIAQALDIPSRNFEHQVLYGMADQLATALVEQGRRVRIYCPYGQLLPGMSYLIRRLLENTANSSFLRQSLEVESIGSLLAEPETSSQFAVGDSRLEAMVEARERFAELTSYTFAKALDTDYAQPLARERAQAALKLVQAQLGQTYWPWIGGKSVTTPEISTSVNPSQPDQVVGSVGRVTLELAEMALQAAKAAFLDWQRTSAQERAEILRRAATRLEERRAELAYWMVLEVGKILREADVEITEAIDFCRYYAAEMERLDAGYSRDLPGETNQYHYQPRGIVAVISPWNFPLAIPLGMTVAALVAGNCVVLKPAEPASVIAAKFTEMLVEAGMPAGVFQYLPGPGSVLGPYLTQHPDVHMIAFTGSQAVGCQIYADAAVLRPGQRHLKRVIAEMGGKNAIIVDQSADLDQAVAGVVHSAFGYSGQKCSACSRVIVLDGIYESFGERLVAATTSLQVGPAMDLETTVGPVVTAKAQAQIQGYIEQGKAEARLALAMPTPETGYFVGPTIFTEVSPQATIAQEEIFGPVLAVIRAADFDAAIAIANDTPYALTGGLYSRTPSHIARAKAEFAVGNLYLNRGITGAIVDRQPFGGFKLSGVGSKAGGRDYLLQFLEPRVITENVQRHGFAPIEGVDY